MNRVERIFELLGVVANEEVYLFDSKERYRITDQLTVEHKTENDTWEVSTVQISELLQDDFITKIPKTKLELLHEEMIEQPYEHSLYGFLPTNCFDEEYILQGDMGTEAEMIFLKEKRQVEAEIAFLKKKHPINEWNGLNIHYFIAYDVLKKKLGVSSTYSNVSAAFYTNTKEECIELLDTIGAERYKTYILGL